MANKFTNPQYYQDIANAIRAINGLSRTYTPPQMAQAILDLNIATGEAPELIGLEIVSPPNRINFTIEEIFNLEGIILKALYAGGYYRWLAVDDIITSLGYNYTFTNSDIGTKTITITYRDEWDNIATTTLVISIADYIYGAEWDGTSTTKWTRTDDATNFVDPSPAINNGTGSSPFDDISPWKDMTIVEDSAAGTLVKIPKFYYKLTRNGTAMKIQISMSPFEGSHVSPAHMDRGDGKGERDVVYIGRYHCDESTYKSKTGVRPKEKYSITQFRTSIHNLGDNIWQNDYATRVTIWLLYLVEFADWNSQSVIGYGGGGLIRNGNTDAMQYHTGTNAANKTTYGDTQYRNIEGLWDTVQDWCDGIYFNGTEMYAIMNPANFSNTENGTLVSTISINGGYISEWNSPSTPGYEWCIFPSKFNGSGATYVTDYYIGRTDGKAVALSVGSYSEYQSCGLFMLDLMIIASDSTYIGSRLMKLP